MLKAVEWLILRGNASVTMRSGIYSTLAALKIEARIGSKEGSISI
jgi:hypothetical protein